MNVSGFVTISTHDTEPYSGACVRIGGLEFDPTDLAVKDRIPTEASYGNAAERRGAPSCAALLTSARAQGSR